MLELIIKLIIFTIMPISGFFVIKNLIDSDEKIYSVKNILIIVGLCVANGLIYTSDYKAYTTIFNFCFLVIGYKYIFKISFLQSILLSVCLMLFIFIAEILFYVTVYFPFGKKLVRSYSLDMLGWNFLIGIIGVLISKIKFVKKTIKVFFLKVSNFSKFETLIISFFWIFVINILCYSIFKNNFGNLSVWMSAFIELVFILFMFNYFRDKDRYIGLNEKFDDLYEYVQTMEESLDNEQMNIHEYKNQLSVIRSMTNNKKIKDYIDSLVDECPDDAKWNTELKNLPQGGLKGLLHYKLACAAKKNLNVLITVSPDTASVIKGLSLEDIKQLSRLVGIYMDNAMDAALDTEKKNVALEIYKIKDTVNIVISNSANIDESKVKMIGKKGFTSKGKGHGRGTYLAKKMLVHNKKFSASNSVVKDYYIERIIIN